MKISNWPFLATALIFGAVDIRALADDDSEVEVEDCIGDLLDREKSGAKIREERLGFPVGAEY